MHKARAFFFVCAGIFLLALSYHLGARSAGAQAGSQIVGFTSDGSWRFAVITSSGDVYWRALDWGSPDPTLYHLGNFWSGATAAQSISIGQLKAKYAK